MKTLPLRYLGWMTRDLLRGPGLVILVVGLVATFAELGINGVGVLGARRTGIVFVLLATAGIVSRDLTGVYHRTLFARPVTPALYYLQRWLLGAVAVVVAALLLDIGLSLRLHFTMVGPNLLARSAVTYLLLGSLVFLLSTVTRRDWIIAVLLMFGHAMLGTLRSAGVPSGSWSGPASRVVYTLLPPFHLIGLHHPVAWDRDLAHAALYGFALLLAALAVLHWRPLASGLRD